MLRYLASRALPILHRDHHLSIPLSYSTIPGIARFLTTIPDDLLPVVAIIGRPNVGKSALFNRLTRTRKAFVHDTPAGHVTRDYQEAPAKLADLPFTAVDTSGLEPFLPSGTIQARATILTTHVLQRSEVALFLIDGRQGILPSDQALAKWLRAGALGNNQGISHKVVLVANKCERRNGGEAGIGWALTEAARLGYGEAVAVSAETGEGMADLYQVLMERLDPILEERRALVREIITSDNEAMVSKSNKNNSDENVPIKVAIMGLVNVGKSTLINQLLNEPRCLTGPEPGLTRDAITVTLQVPVAEDNQENEGSTTSRTRSIELVDTAGWLKKAQLRHHDPDSGGIVAGYSLSEGRTVLRFVHIVVLVIDGTRVLATKQGLTHAESSLVGKILEEGRGLMILVNKMDQVTRPNNSSGSGEQDLEVIPRVEELKSHHPRYQTVVELVQRSLEQVGPEGRGCTILAASALLNLNTDTLLPSIIQTYDTWNIRIPTAKLNRWLRDELLARLPPGGPSRDIQRIKYLCQVKSRPPTFAVIITGKAAFNESAERFLSNKIKEEYGLEGVPVRVLIRHRVRTKGGNKDGSS